MEGRKANGVERAVLKFITENYKWMTELEKGKKKKKGRKNSFREKFKLIFLNARFF